MRWTAPIFFCALLLAKVVWAGHDSPRSEGTQSTLDTFVRERDVARTDSKTYARLFTDAERVRGKNESLTEVLSHKTPRSAALDRAEALARGLERLSESPQDPHAMRELVGTAREFGGSLRPLLLRLVPKAGDATLAPLLLLRKDAASDLRSFIGSALLELGKRTPSDVILVKNTAHLPAILDALGKTRDLDCLPAVMGLVGADEEPVRQAARLSIREYGSDALWKLREAHLQLTGAPNEQGSPEELARVVFAEHDKIRLRDMSDLAEAGFRHAEARRWEAAVESFQKVLSKEPSYPDKHRFVPAYAAWAEELRIHEPGRARALLGLARELSTSDDEQKTLESASLVLHAEELVRRGLPAEQALEDALRAHPANERATMLLSIGREQTREVEQRRRNRTVMASTIPLLLLIGSWMLSRLGKRPARKSRAT